MAVRLALAVLALGPGHAAQASEGVTALVRYWPDGREERVAVAPERLEAFARDLNNRMPGTTVVETSASSAASAEVPFVTTPVGFPNIAGQWVTVAFQATASADGAVLVTARGQGRDPVFTISAPAGGTVAVSGATVTGVRPGAGAVGGVQDRDGTTIASCRTATTASRPGPTTAVNVPTECRLAGATVQLWTGLSGITEPPSGRFGGFSERYFPETRFWVDHHEIWQYFNRRGGVAAFGYPISRAFLLQGFMVQFFQRRVVQLDHQGQPRLLNLLDPGLLPYTSFNGAVLPPPDPALVGGAPDPTDASAALAFVGANAPDVWQGVPVNFLRTFRATVPFEAAFPAGGDPSLLSGVQLEMWGLPTSRPAFDPHNDGFVYQRFQRGVMHHDRRCGCTQGLLLGDRLKAIITGQDVPADLEEQARTSPLYRQYAPDGPRSVRDPALLPDSDLTAAFVGG